MLISWSIPSQNRSGRLLVTGLNIGAEHAALKEILDESENTKTTRSMYAETRQERIEVLQAVRDSEWNREMNPLVVHVTTPHVVKHDFSKGYILVLSVYRSHVVSDTILQATLFFSYGIYSKL